MTDEPDERSHEFSAGQGVDEDYEEFTLDPQQLSGDGTQIDPVNAHALADILDERNISSDEVDVEELIDVGLSYMGINRYEEATETFERAQSLADNHGVDIDTVVGIGDPARAIIKRADDHDTVVMGSHGQHSEDVARGFLIGNVAQKVFRRSPVPVTTVR